MENIHIGRDDLSTVAGGHLLQNSINDLFFAEWVKSDTPQQYGIPLRDKGFRGHLHTK